MLAPSPLLPLPSRWPVYQPEYKVILREGDEMEQINLKTAQEDVNRCFDQLGERGQDLLFSGTKWRERPTRLGRRTSQLRPSAIRNPYPRLGPISGSSHPSPRRRRWLLQQRTDEWVPCANGGGEVPCYVFAWY